MPIVRSMIAAILITTVPVGLLSLALYIPISGFVTHQYESTVDPSDIRVLTILSGLYAVVSCTSTVLLAAVEGLGRLDLKNYVLIFANLVALPATTFMLGTFGFRGLGLVYLSMGSTQLLCAIATLFYLTIKQPRVKADNLPVAQVVRMLWKENAKLSLIALMRLSFEPVTKLLLSFVGSLDNVAAFELALRVSTQVRTLIQSAAQPLLVVGSISNSDLRGAAQATFWRYSALIAIASGLLLELQIIGAPLVSLLGLGFHSDVFLIYFSILAISGSINAMGLSGYFYQLSSGQLDPLTRIHVVMALSNAVMGVLGAFVLGPVGVVLAYALTFAIGGVSCLRLLTRQARGSRALTHLAQFWGYWSIPRMCLWFCVGVFLGSVDERNAPLLTALAVSISLSAWGAVSLYPRRKLIMTIFREGA